MKFYKLIIFSAILISISSAQFDEVYIQMDYVNVDENQMFIFENFEDEIRNYFLINHFLDE